MDLVDFAVDHARTKGATYAEARFEKQEPENFILKNGVLDALYVGHDQGIGVRVLANGALGFAATNTLTKSAVRGIVDDAIKIAKASRRKTKITFAQEDSIAMNWSVPESKKLADVPVEEKIAEIRDVGREAAQAGKSFIPPEGIGMKVGSELVNVVDDPTVEHAIAYYQTDDEGVKARRRYLYKEGRVREFLQNRETAAALHTRSNGAARAVNYNVEAIVRMANTFVEPKDHTVEEMLEDVKFGVYMKTFMEWNIDDKRYNAKYAGREAYLVENGEVKHPVRNTIIELTTPAFWSAVDAVGKDLYFEAGFCGKSDPGQALDASMGGPTIRLRNVYLR